jgi:long-subunit fatty acid transport protein
MVRYILCVLALWPALARANTPEDVFGASGRTIAMGGAGTALPGDYAAAHYNPAALSGCTSDELQLDASYLSHHLSFTDTNKTAAQPLVPKQTPDQTRLMLGTCLALPFDLHLGVMFGFGTPGALKLVEQTADQSPRFMMYGDANDQVVFALGLAWRATGTLSIGVGFAALLKGQLPITADLPILEPDPMDPSGYQPVSFSLGVDLGAYLAPRVGVLWTPSPHFRIGAAYRGTLYASLGVDAKLDAKLIIDIPAPVHIDALGWFSPRQFSAGASGEPTDNVTLTADVTYYRWGELASHDSYYPFLNMYTLDPNGPSGALVFPHPIRSGWQDDFAVRAGGELRLRDRSIAIRGGAGYRTSAIDNPGNSNVNLLDGPTVSAATGVAYYAGSTSGPHGHWWRYTLPRVSFRADVFVRDDHMLAQTVDHTAASLTAVIPEKHFSYGGDVLQVGAMLTLGW